MYNYDTNRYIQNKYVKIIIGLGNPGQKFENTRHNFGFMVIDAFAEKNNFPEFNFSKKFNALISESDLGGEKIILVKPQTFMNESGKAVRKITLNYKLKTVNLVVVHDDIDLLIGKIKIALGRGSAGHKGVQSIIKEIGTKNFIRLRIGIKTEDKKIKAEKVVLKKFNREEEKTIKEIVKTATSAIEDVLKDGIEKAISACN